MRDITKNWNVKSNVFNASRVYDDPYVVILGDLTDKTSDLTLCSIWLNLPHIIDFDLGAPYDNICCTLLAPLPNIMNEIETVYKSLGGIVWIVYISCFVLTGIILKLMTKIHVRDLHISLGHIFMDLLSISTSHGIVQLPNNSGMKLIIIRYARIFYSL